MIKLPTVSQHMKIHKITANKSFGQHFLLDLNICNKIISVAPSTITGKVVLEVGPGPGGLTRAILACNPKKLIAIEKDISFIKLLHEIPVLSSSKLEIIYGDALHFDLSSIKANHIIIISNLPYNIGTKLIVRWLHQISLIEYIIVMLQDEVVERIISSHSKKKYGRLTVLSQLVSDVRKCFKVSSKVFNPPPKIDSSVLLMVPKKQQLDKHTIENVQNITKLAFNSRRKKLKNCLGTLLTSKNITNEVFNTILHQRPEQLTPEQYVQLSRILL
ncbi:dimethyladenosine transferase [Orientia chuto str. Dubai]|uniref:Ribosomal RNA small subunit methyltransferase A n=1 Tax=Orientia chuto str. Dubai TaxID=1359168 RepID=A0A0F3MM87_9RICK|nr:16S rRNA (adenine(1518)-N(6)/adenine(1519)-N(6))-dimethyltransferase RsmA [Candidatus Orientia mediorientalis]KJV56776.1 dimethyladenosine transferase [Orientia chuto str. Dubai]